MDSLKDAFPFESGVALGGLLPDAYSPAELSLIRRQFSNITPENCMKPEPIHPAEDRFDFRLPDAFVAFAQANRLNITGHCLVWHQQCPKWMLEDGNAAASRQQVLSRMQRHIEAVLERYHNKTQGWDVVNEAIDDGPGYIRDSLWKQTVGEDYVIKAFEFAQAADPAVRLYYNDYHDEMPDKRGKTLRLLKELLSRGIRVAAIGIQGHWCLDKVPFEQIEAAIQEYSSLGLKVMITELDIDVVERSSPGADILARDSSAGDPFAAGLPSDIGARQAEQYAQLFRIFRRNAEKISRVTFWGLHDGRSWLNGWPRKRTNHALLWDRNAAPKSALQSVLAMA